jgi:flagella basal body P-ring formation protein FlgA
MRNDSMCYAAFFPHLAVSKGSGGKAASAWLLAIGLLLAVAPGTLLAAPTANQQIEQSIDQYWRKRLTHEASTQHWQDMQFTHKNTPLNSSLKLSTCSQSPEVSSGGDNSLTHQRLSVRCPDQPGWSVEVSSQASIRVAAVFAGQVIERGQTISADQLKLRELDISKAPHGFFSGLDEVVGKGAKRRIRANQVVDSSLLAMPLLVRRGEEVKIVASREGINAATQGQALEDGEQGAVIRVRNLSSNKTIDAQVLESGVVTSTFK